MVFLYLYNQKGGKKDNRNRLDVPPNRFDFDASARVRFLNEKDTHKKRDQYQLGKVSHAASGTSLSE